MRTIKKYTIEELNHGSYLNAIENQRDYLIESNGINEFLEFDVDDLLKEHISIFEKHIKLIKFDHKVHLHASLIKAFPNMYYDGSKEKAFSFESKDLHVDLIKIEKAIAEQVTELYDSYLDDYNVHFTIDPQEKQFDFDGNIIY